MFTSQVLGQNSSKARMSVQLNQLVYEPSDKLNVTVKIEPRENIPDVRLSLKLGEKDKYTYSRTYYLGNLKQGKIQTASFNKNTAAGFGLSHSRNHMLVELSSRQKIYSKFSTDLGVIDNDTAGKIKVALAINVAHKPHLDIDKNVTDTQTQKKLLPILEKYQQLSTKHKGFFNFILNPLLMETIDKIGSGYNLATNGNIVPIPSSSPSSLKAKGIKEGFRQLFKTGTAKLILSYYSQANAERLTTKAQKDAIKEGMRILDDFGQPYVATYPSNDFTAPALKGHSKQEATLRALANLVEANNEGKKQMILVTPQMVNPEYVSHFIASAKKQNWLQLVPIHKLKLTKKLTKLTNKQSEIEGLSSARKKYFTLKDGLSSANAAFEKAKMAIFLAEDSNSDEKAALELTKKANDLLSRELQKVFLKLSPLTLTGRYGKLPVRVVNNTESKFNLYLHVKSNNFEFKKNNIPAAINPKENLISIPVKVIRSGRQKILVTLKTKDAVISQKYLVVSTSLPSQFWYYIGLLLIILLLLFIGAFYVREKRSRRSG